MTFFPNNLTEPYNVFGEITNDKRRDLVGYAKAYKCTAQLAVDALGKAVKEYDAVCAPLSRHSGNQ